MMDLLYDEISDSDAMALKEHLSVCTDCRNNYDDVRDGSDMLKAWPDRFPKVKMLFSEDRKPFSFRKYLKVPAIAAAAVLVLLSLANLRISSSNGEIRFSMSLLPQSSARDGNYVTYDDLKKIQDENMFLTNQIINEKYKEQGADNYRVMNQLARGLEQQRQEDMETIMTSFVRYQQTNNDRLEKTNQNFLDLLHYTDIKLKRDNGEEK